VKIVLDTNVLVSALESCAGVRVLAPSDFLSTYFADAGDR